MWLSEDRRHACLGTEGMVLWGTEEMVVWGQKTLL